MRILNKTCLQLQDMKEMVEAARVTVKRIQSKTMRKKLMLWLVIAVMFIIDVYMIYRMARNGGSLIGSSSSSSGSSSSSLSSSTFVGSSYLSDWMIPFDFLHSSHNLRGI